MLKLATILDNPGEPPTDSRYRNFNDLADLGYNGVVLYETTGLSGVDSPDHVGSAEMRRWIENQFEHITQTIAGIKAAGLDVYIAYDVFCLARSIVDRDVNALTCRNRPRSICPASDAALNRCGEALSMLLGRWPTVDGVVLRFGDNDAARLSYMVGSDLYQPHCARCSELGRVDRITRTLEHFYKVVVEDSDRRLIARAWNVRPGGMHDTVDLCQRLADRLPGSADDDRLVLSFKFSETDFWRYQRWNPASLVFGDRPIIYELQCQREFEGKGGIPNWQAPLWRDGFDEMPEDQRGGLNAVADHVNLGGIWAWVRGGGWGGPFVKNESWIDANVFAAPKLADDPSVDIEQVAQQWARQRLQLEDAAAIDAVVQVLSHSTLSVRQGFYVGPYAKAKADRWHTNGDWIQDDVIDARAAWRMIQRIRESQLDEVTREKDEAVDQMRRDRKLLDKAVPQNRVLEPLANTLVYAQSLFEALRDLMSALVLYRRYLNAPSAELAAVCRKRIVDAQSFWNHHTQRHGALKGAATVFREEHFWELTQQMLTELDDSE